MQLKLKKIAIPDSKLDITNDREQTLGWEREKTLTQHENKLTSYMTP